jgi:hypothetical protein
MLHQKFLANQKAIPIAAHAMQCAYGDSACASAICQKAYQVKIVVITQNQFLSYLRSPASTPSINFVNSSMSILFAARGLAAPSKLHGNVGFYNRHAIHLFLPLLLRFQLLVFAEMLDVFRVRQVFLARVLVVVFLPVVDLVLVLIVAVMAGSKTKIRQREPFGYADGIFCVGDGAAAICIEELEDFVHGVFFLLRGDVVGRLVFQAVGFGDVVARPLVAAVVVVEVEEGAGVEGGDVVLLWNAGQPIAISHAIKVVAPYRTCVWLPSLHQPLRAAVHGYRAPGCRRLRLGPVYSISRALLVFCFVMPLVFAVALLDLPG